MERNLADIDDAMALANLKTLKASDAMVDQMMAAANVIEDEGVNDRPASLQKLFASAVAACRFAGQGTERGHLQIARHFAAHLTHVDATGLEILRQIRKSPP
jgi:hypothetical protein